MKYGFKEWQKEEGKETERRQGREKGMIGAWKIDLRNDRRKKERKLGDDKEEKMEWWGMKDWFKEWLKEEVKEIERRKVREKGMMRNERLI